MYMLLLDGQPLCKLNKENNSVDRLITRTEQEAGRLCSMLDGILGEVRYCKVDIPEEKPTTYTKYNVELPGLDKTLNNIPKGYNPEFQ